MNREKLIEDLILDEGIRYKPYKCSAGFLTIGVGHNLDAKPISDGAVKFILNEDIDDVVLDLHRAYPWWGTIKEPAQRALVNMAFNLGPRGVDKFQNMLGALRVLDYEEAAKQSLDSLWSSQVGARSERIAQRYRS